MARLRDFLIQFFMPWRQTDRLYRVSGTISLITWLLTIAVLITDKAVVPMLVALALLLVMFVIMSIRGLRDSKKSTDRLVALYCAQLVDQGHVRIEDLPVDMQENVRVEYARYVLRDKTN